MKKKTGLKIFDELAKKTWIENYKYRLFVDLLNQGGDLHFISNLQLSSKAARKLAVYRIRNYLDALKAVTEEHESLIESLEVTFELKKTDYLNYIEKLYQIAEKISDMSQPRRTHGRSTIKGHSSAYIYELLNSNKLKEFDWDWFKDFIRGEISNKKFTSRIFKKLPANISLPTINENRFEEKYWYKTLKEQNKTSECPPQNLDHYKQLYFLIKKQAGEEFKLARTLIT